jgi:hypothetical protein
MIAWMWMSCGFSYYLTETGYLRNTHGLGLNQTVSIEYKLYEQETGGFSIWNYGPVSVEVKEGIYSVPLGVSGNALNESYLYKNSDYYLGKIVNGETLSPRQRLSYVPRAVFERRAAYADTAGKAAAVDWKDIQNVPSTVNVRNPLKATTQSGHGDHLEEGNKIRLRSSYLSGRHESSFGYFFSHRASFQIELIGQRNKPITNGIGYRGISNIFMPVIQGQLTDNNS